MQRIDSFDALLRDLRSTLDLDRVRAEPLELALYSRDAGVARGRAAAVCFPRPGDEVASIVRVAARPGRAVGGGGGG